MPNGHVYHDKVTAPDVVVTDLDLKGVDFDAIKAQVRFRTQGDIANLATGAPLSPDGAPVVAGDRILVGQQTDPIENGLYVVVVPGTGADGTWVRASDLPTGATTSKWLVMVLAGTDAGELYYPNTTGTPLVGTDPLPFAEFTGGATPTGLRRTIQFTVSGAGGPGTTDSVAAIPAGNQVFSCTVDVQVPFDGAAVLDVGDTATAALIFAQAQADLTVADSYEVDQTTAWPLASVVRATLGGASTVGTAVITVVYGLVDA